MPKYICLKVPNRQANQVSNMRKREMGQVSWRELRDKKRKDKFMKERKKEMSWIQRSHELKMGWW